MTKPVTCATLVQFENTILACHATGSTHWDLPKGVAEPDDELYSEAAVRELQEETGIILPLFDLDYVTTDSYSSEKDIILFHHRLDKKPVIFECTSTFTTRGCSLTPSVTLPEVDDYAWMTLDEFIKATSNVMRRFLQRNQTLIEEHLTAS